MSRLPLTGSDDGTWGDILNDFLAVTHNTDGTIKTGLIVETQLSSAVQAKLNGGGVSGVSSVNTRTGAVTLTANDVGLANADNTSDVNKPISTAAQTALNLKANTSSLAVVATTGAYSDLSGKPTIPAAQVNSDWNAVSGLAQILNKPTVPAQLNATAGTNVTITGTYPNLTFGATPGAGVTDLTTTTDATTVTVVSSTGADGIIASADASNAGVLTAADKTKLDGIASGAQANTVTSVATRTGAVVLTKSDVGLGNVDNTADASKAFAASQITSGTLAIGLIPTGTTSTTVSLGNHTHTATQISDSTAIGRTVLTAVDAAAVRTAIGAGTSSLIIGTTSTTAKAGDYAPTKSDVGLANVDNTSDATKNSASVTLTNKTISGASNTLSNIPESAVTNLTTDLAAKASGLAVTTVKTSAYTAAANQFVPVDTTSGAVTVTLPTAPADGSRITVKHVIQGSTNVVTVACGSSDVFNKASGSTTATLTLVNQAITLQYYTTGAIWYVVSDDLPLSGLDSRYLLSSAAGNQVKVYNAYSDAPALAANTVVVSITGS